MLPSTYKGGDAEFVVTKKQASCVGWNNFCPLNGKSVGECSNFKKIPTHTQDHGDA